MNNITYRSLELHDCEHLIDINPQQFIGKAWRDINGKRQLLDINYQDNGWPNGYDKHYNSLRNTILSGGCGFGAFDVNNKLLGFSAVNRDLFGSKYKYILLDQIFISLEHRGKGIGRKLFELCVDAAKDWNADRIYICAGSAEETIKFYSSIGCQETVEINIELYKRDSRDIQLEYVLQKR